FGTDGRIDLRENLGRDPQLQGDRLTSPGVIFKDLMIIGGRVGEGLPTSPGDVRAYDVNTGALRWSFHTIPHPGEFGYDTWPPDAWKVSGGANAWAGVTVEQARGMVFAATGSASFDFYGSNRIGDNLFANTVLALDVYGRVNRSARCDPPSVDGAVIFPGVDGGGEWGGPAFEPETGLLYVNANERGWTLKMVPRNDKSLYGSNCASCHGEYLKGSP